VTSRGPDRSWIIGLLPRAVDAVFILTKVYVICPFNTNVKFEFDPSDEIRRRRVEGEDG